MSRIPATPPNRPPRTGQPGKDRIKDRVEKAIGAICSPSINPAEMDSTLKKDCETLESFFLKLFNSKENKLKKLSKITAYSDESGNLYIDENDIQNEATSVVLILKNTNTLFNYLVNNNQKFKSANKLVNLIHRPIYPTYFSVYPNKDKIQEIVFEEPCLIPLLPEKFLNDNFILSAIERNPIAIKHLPKKFLNDNFILSAIERNPSAIKHLPEKFLNDNFILSAIERKPIAIKHLPEKFLNYNFILSAIERNPRAIDYLTLDHLNLDQKKDIIEKAPIAAAQCKHLIADLIHTGDLQKIIKTAESPFILLAERTIRDLNFARYPSSSTLIRDTPKYLLSQKKPPDSLLHYANDTLRKNPDFVIDMGIVNPAALYYAHPELTKNPKFIQKASKLESLMVPKHAFVYADPSIDIHQSKKIWSFLKQTGALDETNRNRLRISVVRKLLKHSVEDTDIPNGIDKNKIMKALEFLNEEFENPQLISKHLYSTAYLEFMLELVRRNPQALGHADPDLAQNNWFLDHLNRHIPHQTISKGAFISPTVALRQSKVIYKDLMKKNAKTPSRLLDRTGKIQREPDIESLKANYGFSPTIAKHVFDVLTKAYTATPANDTDTRPWVIETYASDEFKEKLPIIPI